MAQRGPCFPAGRRTMRPGAHTPRRPDATLPSQMGARTLLGKRCKRAACSLERKVLRRTRKPLTFSQRHGSEALMTKRGLVGLVGCVTILSAPAGARGPQAQTSGPASPSTPPQRAALDRYCVGCHNDKTRTAGLALDGADFDQPGDHAETWERVVRKLRGRMMPPGRPRPDEATYGSLVSYLETALDRSAAARPNPGRVDTFRRLNRTEYQ